jgi:hypothetical protein
MAIDVEVRPIAVHALADLIGHPADGKNVCGAIEGERIVRIQPLAGDDFVINGPKPRITGLKGMQAGHRFRSYRRGVLEVIVSKYAPSEDAIHMALFGRG